MSPMIDRRSFTSHDDSRLRVLALVAAVGFGWLLFRLFQLQIFQGQEMFRLAEQNRTQVIPVSAPRGVVVDRRGDVLLDNAPNFSLFYSKPAVLSAVEQSVEKELVRWFPGQEVLLRKKLAEARRTGKMTRLVPGIPRPVALALIERRLALPGVNVMVEPRRRSRYGDFASHVLGYVDEVNPAELERMKDRGYRQGQLIGKTGIERHYNSYLRGEDGGIQFEMDASGRHLQVIQRIPSVSGARLHLTLDQKLQDAAERGLAASPTGRGAAVALDPRTGAVLALASAPDFDPSANLLSSLKDPKLPLFNRALQGSYPAGSVFKIVTGASGLQDAHWDIHKTFFCPGVFRLGSKEFGCWDKHYTRDFLGAMAWSCNVYFFNIGLKAGAEKLERMARAFGLSEKTGVDLPSESSGFIPGPDWKRRTTRVPWFDGDTVNLSIGQGAVSVTPIQAAVLISAMANGGKVWRPYVLDHVVSAEGQLLFEQKPMERKQLGLSPYTMKILRQALEGVVTGGSGQRVNRPDLVAAAKTGTAQNPHGDDHAWFVCYAGRPGEEPSLAVAVFIENGGHGAQGAGPVARAIIDAAFPKPEAPAPAEKKT